MQSRGEEKHQPLAGNLFEFEFANFIPSIFFHFSPLDSFRLSSLLSRFLSLSLCLSFSFSLSLSLSLSSLALDFLVLFKDLAQRASASRLRRATRLRERKKGAGCNTVWLHYTLSALQTGCQPQLSPFGRTRRARQTRALT